MQIYPKTLMVLTLILAMLAGGAPDASAAERLPYEYFAKSTDYHDVKISPDGKHYGIRFEQDDRIVMVFIERAKMKMSGSVGALRDGSVIWFNWVNDERVLYEASVRDSYLDTPVGNGNLFAVNRNGSKHDLIYGIDAGNQNDTSSLLNQKESSYSSYEVVSTMPDDDKRIIIAEYPFRQVGRLWRTDSRALVTVTRLNVYSGRQRKLDVLPIPGARALVDNNNAVRFAIGSNEDSSLAVQWKPDEDADWQKFDVTGLGISSAVPFSFSQDNQAVFISGQPDEGGTRAIYKLHLAAGEKDLIYQNKVANISGFVRDIQDRTIVGLFADTGQPEYEYLQSDSNTTVHLHKSLMAAFKGQDVDITSHTDDAEEIIIRVSSSVNPGEFYLFNTKTNKAEFLFAQSSWVDPRKMRPKQAVMIPARDGLKLLSYLTLPDDSGEPAPLVVMVHGGPHGPRDWWSYDSDTQFLANRGYAVLQVNYRGSGGFGPDFIQAGYGEWGGKMQDDLTDATRWAIEQGHADAQRVCIYGASYGGYAALMGVAKEPELYRCAVGSVGVYDLKTFLKVGNIPKLRTGKGYLEKAVGHDPELLQARSPAQNADKIKAKVLLVHGGEDTQVPIVHAEKMREALQQAGNPPEWLVFQREGHGYANVDNRIEFYRKLEAFLDQHIGSRSDLEASNTEAP